MIAGTLVNVAAGSGLKIAGYVLGQIVDGYFKNKALTTQALAAKADNIIKLNSGDDTADDFTKLTRRVIAWMFSFTICFVIATFALDANDIVPMLTNREHGVFGWIFGGSSQETVHVTKAQMITNMWGIFEMMVGFFFTKLGGKS